MARPSLRQIKERLAAHMQVRENILHTARSPRKRPKKYRDWQQAPGLKTNPYKKLRGK